MLVVDFFFFYIKKILYNFHGSCNCFYRPPSLLVFHSLDVNGFSPVI